MVEGVIVHCQHHVNMPQVCSWDQATGSMGPNIWKSFGAFVGKIGH